jgi:hypothetical protein
MRDLLSCSLPHLRRKKRSVGRTGQALEARQVCAAGSKASSPEVFGSSNQLHLSRHLRFKSGLHVDQIRGLTFDTLAPGCVDVVSKIPQEKALAYVNLFTPIIDRMAPSNEKPRRTSIPLPI